MTVDSVIKANRKALLPYVFTLGLSAVTILWAPHDGATTRYLQASIRDPIGIDHTQDFSARERELEGLEELQKELKRLEELQKEKENKFPSMETVSEGPEELQKEKENKFPSVETVSEDPEVQKEEGNKLPSTETASGAIDFVLGRREAYHRIPDLEQDELPIANQWKLRGHGYLYNTLNLILAAEGPKQKQVQMGRNVVKIWNVHPKTASSFQDCSLLALWVRVNGPEIFAGPATTVPPTAPNKGCHWEYEFDIQKKGDYEIDVKVVLWNGNAPTQFFRQLQPEGGRLSGGERTVCPDATADKPPPPEILADAPSPYNNGFLGFKFYAPVMSCCEICRRTKGCIYWKTPPENFVARRPKNGCQLYYNSTIVEAKDIPRSYMLHRAGIKQQQRHRRLAGIVLNASGTPNSDISEVGYFLGCGWSFHFTLDYPCLSGDLDDQVFMMNRSFTVASESSESSSSLSSESNLNLPLCQLADEAFAKDHKSTGRWVREQWPNKTICPSDFTFDQFHSKMVPITAMDPNHPHCWHRDDLSNPANRCGEPNCRLIVPTSKWNASSLHHEKEWMGVWRRYNCNYQEFTQVQLQQCVNKRQISSITVKGASIAGMSGEYLKVRLTGIEFPEGANKEVVIDSLKWPHVIWNNGEQDWPAVLEALPTVNAERKEHYFFTSFYTASEREPYVQVARAERFSRFAEKILLPKGYKMINAFELSAAFSFDTGGQGDGLHVLGPPMKAIMTKAFHHMCSDVVDGSIV